MNKKLTVINSSGVVVFCVLSSDEPYEDQLGTVLGLHPGQGFCASLEDKELVIRDYFAGETRASLEILRFEDTQEDVCLYWQKYIEGSACSGNARDLRSVQNEKE